MRLLWLLCFAMVMGCGKFKLLKDISPDPIPAGQDLKKETIWQWLSVDHTTDLTGLTNFAKAVEKAGLIDTFSHAGDYTVILFRDDAVATMASKLGYPSVDDVPGPVWKNLLLENIFRERIHSYDLAINETRQFTTIAGSPLYLSREASSTDQYLFYVNNLPELTSPKKVAVRSQNLEFLNGVVHVVDQFTYYETAGENADAPDPDLPTKKDTFWVTKDVYLRGKTYVATNYNDPASILIKNTSNGASSNDRRGLIQYELREPTFGNKIGTAKLNVYASQVGSSTANFDLSAYQLPVTDFDENTVSWNSFPDFINKIGTVNVPKSTTGWYTIDITNTIIQSISNQENFINVGYFHSYNDQITLRPKEYNNGQYESFISLTGPPLTILSLSTNNTLQVSAQSGMALLSTTTLKMEGTASKNIAYTINQEPEHGYLVRYGMPLKVNAAFSQADMEAGAIKYLYDGTGNTDKVVLEAKDSNGGYFQPLITLQVQIQ